MVEGKEFARGAGTMSEGQAVILKQVRTLFGVGAMGPLPDAELLDRFATRRGEEAELAFGALVDRHGPMVLGVTRRILGHPEAAQDAFQATFLVLARKAGQIGQRDLLAHWLHGVATRTALKARTASARRRRHERASAASTPERFVPEPEEDRRELWAALHEEIARLPEKYRGPVLLCHLGGMTHERASAQLNCPAGTVGVRLMRARERLRSGMTRRGFAPATGLILAGSAAETAMATAAVPVPAALAASTVRASASFARGGLLASEAVSARVLELAKGVLKAMSMTRTRAIAATLLLAGAFAGGVGVLAQPKAPAVASPPPEASQPVAKGEEAWKKTLPGGTTVELIGISTNPSGPKTWWAPNGSPLGKAPLDQANRPFERPADRKMRGFAVRVTVPKGIEGFATEWSIAQSSGYGADSSGTAALGVVGAWADLPSDAGTTTVRLGTAIGAWKTELTAMGGGTTAIVPDQGSIGVTRARAIPKGCAIVAADSLRGPNVRIVAVDLDGKEHTQSAGSVSSSGNLRMSDLEFDLPLDRVKEIRFQTRPFEWVEFKDVPLEPREVGDFPGGRRR